MDPVANRVQIAAHHWQPRFVANGIDVNDFENVLAKTVEWKDWGPNWHAMGGVHEDLGREAEGLGRMVSAAAAYQRAAWCYHLGKFLWFEDLALHATLRDQAVAVYGRSLPQLDPPAERLEIPFEGKIIPGHLRRPNGTTKPPLVIIVPGLDSSKEEMFSIEDEFLRRGMATLSIDGPGQSENSVDFAIRPNWETVITPLLDHLAAAGLDSGFGLIGLMGISMGAIYGPRAAAHEPRLNAVVGLAARTPRRLLGCAQPVDAGRLHLLHEIGRRGGGPGKGVRPEPPWRPRKRDATAARHPWCARPPFPRAGRAHRA